MHPPVSLTLRRAARALAPLALILVVAACGSTGTPGGGESVASTQIDSPVVGYWRIASPGSAGTTAQFCPTGSVRVMSSDKSRIAGRYMVHGDELTIVQAGHAQPTTYRYRIGADGMRYEPALGATPPAWMGTADLAWQPLK